MIPTIKLMTDYGCFPLWGVDKIGNIDPETLPITGELRARLKEWSSWYDGILNPEDPAKSDFSNLADKSAFEAEGKKLWQDLQDQLRGHYQVVYFSVVDNQVKKPLPNNDNQG